jgi:hypothetical protein
VPAAALDAQHYVPAHGDAQPLTLCTALSASLPASLQPVVHAFQATVQHSGFEDFTVEFPWSECLQRRLQLLALRRCTAASRALTEVGLPCFIPCCRRLQGAHRECAGL